MAEREELRPDLLKNTPSNIARLEDLIEHSKVRQKYLAHTSSPSHDGDVRWYFCKIPLAPNELAASVPPTEIVGKSPIFILVREILSLLKHLSCRVRKNCFLVGGGSMSNAVKAPKNDKALVPIRYIH